MIFARSVSKLFSIKPFSLFRFISNKKYSDTFSALSDINFRVDKGDVFGIIGRNGAGKSTLLQLICGTLTPTSGTISVKGRIGALLELGAGFHPDFTGIENIYLTASIMGLTRNETNRCLDAIIDFADIHDFINLPVRTYSTGMSMRLAFAIATSTSPDILVIDEALSVGDQEFSKKSFNKIMSLKDNGTTILFCSHSMYQIEAICDKVIWLESGRIKEQGIPQEVSLNYQEDQLSKVSNSNEIGINLNSSTQSFGQPSIKSIVVSKNGTKSGKHVVLKSRKDTLSLKVFFLDPNNTNPSIAFSIRRITGEMVASCGSFNDRIQSKKDGDGQLFFSVDYPKIALLKGNFRMDVSLFCSKGLHTYDYVNQFLNITVIQSDLEQGICHINHKWN
jgi:lipopolysaccharide transport system ATP-binding protein